MVHLWQSLLWHRSLIPCIIIPYGDFDIVMNDYELKLWFHYHFINYGSLTKLLGRVLVNASIQKLTMDPESGSI